MIRKTVYYCKGCGGEYEAYPTAHRVFCAPACYWKWKKGNTPIQTFSDEECERRRARMMGENNPMWKGGDSDKERRNSAYKKWRIRVFERDGFICRECGYFNGCGHKRRDLNAHHIVGWTKSIELRYEVANDITLCVPCHIKEHTNRS